MRLLPPSALSRISTRPLPQPNTHATFHSRYLSSNRAANRRLRKTMASPPTDYTTWSPSDLISRIHALETQLPPSSPSSNPAPQPYKKPKKPPKPFDPSKYCTRLIALKFAYLGGAYNGFEHHTNNTTPLPTVEEALWKALRKTKLIFPAFKAGREEEVEWEGCGYSKCGRTDRGVSAFGQVVGVRVRSARAKRKSGESLGVKEGDVVGEGVAEAGKTEAAAQDDAIVQDAASGIDPELAEPEFDPVTDELPYIQLLNRVLPPDIRILAWCPDPPPDFSARFNCRERRYRYFFTNPAYPPLPGSTQGDGWLDIPAMSAAAKRYEGLHDFRNFCKVDPSKQITNFERRIFHAGIHAVQPEDEPASLFSSGGEARSRDMTSHGPRLYWFEVRGSAFLWHQVRHLVAILFLVGQGYEDPSLVDTLLDVRQTPSRPKYDMASDAPLVLWDCVFPDPEKLVEADHAAVGGHGGYEDGMNWIYVGDGIGGQDRGKRNVAGVEDGKYGRGGVVEDMWGLWRKRKMDEFLAGSLLNVVNRQGKAAHVTQATGKSDRVFDGGELPRTVGTYMPVMQRERMEEPEIVNARYAARKGLDVARGSERRDVDKDG